MRARGAARAATPVRISLPMADSSRQFNPPDTPGGSRRDPRELGDAHSLAKHLDSSLHEQCKGHLGPITWFHAAWQSGGAETGSAIWTFPDGSKLPCIVKLPVGPAEHAWTTRLGGSGSVDADHFEPELAGVGPCPTPRVLAAGMELGGYDLGWLVVERIPGEPLSALLTPESVQDLIQAIADFHSHAVRIRPVVDERPKGVDWDKSIATARVRIRESGLPEAQRWNEAIKHVQKALPNLLARWGSRPLTSWCHGDLHPGNVFRRTTAGAGASRCVLIDLALVHAGHWIEDAVYLERQYWGRPELLHGVKPVSALAKLRRERGLSIEGDYGALANVRRVLMAALVPLFIDREGHSKYVHAALETIEQALPQVAH